MFTSPREIIELNIEYYSKLLETERNPAVRRTIEGLRLKEEARLAKLEVSAGKISQPQPGHANGME